MTARVDYYIIEVENTFLNLIFLEQSLFIIFPLVSYEYETWPYH